MIINRIKLPLDTLNSVPEPDRTYYVRLAHHLNETNILHKLILWSVHTPTTHPLEDSANHSQTMLFTKLLCGKLYEGRFLITLGHKFAPRLSEIARESLKNLKVYFATENLIAIIRNQFGFHTDVEPLEELSKDLPSNIEYEWLCCTKRHSTLYHFADIVANAAFLSVTGEKTVEAALEKLLREFLQIYNWYVHFGDECLGVMTEQYFPDSLLDEKIEKVEIKTDATIGNVTIPFFVEHEDV